MSKTGPQKYPGASLSTWYQGNWGGDSMESNVIVWHTTEGTSLPTYSQGASAPNFTAVPDFETKKLKWYQHFDFDTSSRALRNLSGGVQTNTNNVVQVEIVGTCDPTTHKRWNTQHLYTPELPDWAIRDLAEFAKWAHQHHGVPLTSGLTFKPYPASYGNNGVRLAAHQWNSFRGHCGHQHVPENDHGDPGAFPIAKILGSALASETPAKHTPQYQPFPGPTFFRVGRISPLITAMGEALVRAGYKGYKRGPGPIYTSADRTAYAWWQRKLGYSGTAADGIPGKTSWDKLKVRKVK